MNEVNPSNSPSLARVLIKGSILFIMVTMLSGFVEPLPTWGKISAYNYIFPGRLRLPYGENPDLAYNFSLYNLQAMFASHEISAAEKHADEYRVVLIGDSSIWGYLLKPENTLSGYINSTGITLDNGKVVRAYNLGYPTMSLAKDFLILSHAMQYEPDLVIWLVTLESFPASKQLDSPIVQNNASAIKELISQYSLNLDPSDSRLVTPNYWESTLIGQRRALADLFRLQMYGVMWAATGIDQYYPSSYEPPQENLDADQLFHDLQPPQLKSDGLSFDILSAGSKLVGNVPVIYINEPVYLSHGENSDIRYNFFYPRWAFDQYREMFSANCSQRGWLCLDVWDLVPPEMFTNSAIHMNPQGTQWLATQVEEMIRNMKVP